MRSDLLKWAQARTQQQIERHLRAGVVVPAWLRLMDLAGLEAIIDEFAEPLRVQGHNQIALARSRIAARACAHCDITASSTAQVRVWLAKTLVAISTSTNSAMPRASATMRP